MATMPIPYPDAYGDEIKDAYWALRRPAEPKEGQQQITKAENVVRCLREEIKSTVIEYRRRNIQEAGAATLKQAETDLA
jgi:hypothetical protein